MSATAQIPNATNFTSNILIRGTPGLKFDAYDGFERILGVKMFKPRSYALICTENSVKRLKQRNTIYEFGNRTIGDFLIHAQNEFVSRTGRVLTPQFTFDFNDDQVDINYVALTSDVSTIC